jgi:hypothetical protein
MFVRLFHRAQLVNAAPRRYLVRMAASPAASHLSLERSRTPRWRVALAALISLALVFSFFHGWSFDSDDGALTISIAQPGCDTTGKTPAHPTPIHSDHCLAHMASVTPQDTTTAIEYVTRGYRWSVEHAPDLADRGSPFKPPRA